MSLELLAAEFFSGFERCWEAAKVTADREQLWELIYWDDPLKGAHFKLDRDLVLWKDEVVHDRLG